MDYPNEIIEKLIADISAKKEAVIKERLKALNIEIDEKLEKTRKFKSIVCEIHGNKEHYFYNDGSEKGIRVVTFIRSDEGILDRDTKEMKLSIEINYY